MRFLAAILAAAALAPAALADAPDVVTHENVDRTRTIDVCGSRSSSTPRASSPSGSTSTTAAQSSGSATTSSAPSRSRGRTPRTESRSRRYSAGRCSSSYFPDGSFTQIVAGRERLFIARGEGPVATQVGRIVFSSPPTARRRSRSSPASGTWTSLRSSARTSPRNVRPRVWCTTDRNAVQRVVLIAVGSRGADRAAERVRGGSCSFSISWAGAPNDRVTVRTAGTPRNFEPDSA